MGCRHSAPVEQQSHVSDATALGVQRPVPVLPVTGIDRVRAFAAGMWADAAQDTLYNILHGPPHARKHFEDFLASQFNEESLHFYLDVEKLFQSGLIPEGQNGQISRQRSSFTRRRLSVGSATSRIIATAGDGVATPKPARISNQCTTADATTPHSPAARIATTAGEPDEEVAGESPVPLLNGPQNGQLSASAASAASDGEAEAAASAAAARESAAWAQAQSIYQRFIASSAPSEINLPSKIKEQQFSQQNYQGFLMDAQQEILRLLVLDAFPRFLQSPYCELMLQALGRMQQQQQQQSSAPSAPASAGSAPSALEAQVVETRNNLGDARSPRSWLEAFMHVADVLPASIVVSDMSQPHAPIVYANPAFCTMTGYPKAEAEGRNCKYLQGADTKSQTVELLRRAISRAVPVRCELLNYKKDGTPFRNYLTLRPVLRDQPGVPRTGTGGTNASPNATSGSQPTAAANPGVGLSRANSGNDESTSSFHQTFLTPLGVPQQAQALAAVQPVPPITAADDEVAKGAPESIPAHPAASLLPQPLPTPAPSSSTAAAAAAIATPGSMSGSSTLFRHPHLAYYIGVQYEISDGALVPQKLMRHEALLRMLPTRVAL